MKRNTAAMAAAVTMLLASSSEVQGQSTARQEMQFAQFFVGTWSCAHSVGDFSGTYVTTIATAMDDKWLKQTYDFPVSGESSAPIHAEYFIGFDARVQRWIRFGAMTNGQYYVMVAKRSGNTLSFGYVLPGTTGNATYTKQSDSEFTVEGPSYPENGKTVTEHHTCRKSS